MAEHIFEEMRREAAAAGKCHWSPADKEGRYSCSTHKGGFFKPGAEQCSASPDPWAQADYAAQRAFEKVCDGVRSQLHAFEGWRLLGHLDDGMWHAAGPAGHRARVEVKAPTPEGLLERVRALTDPNHREPSQGVLL